MFRRYFWISLMVTVLLLGSMTAVVAVAGGSVLTRSGSVPDRTMTPVPEGVTVHVVRSGETLTKIARRYGVGMRELAAYNGIANPDRIYVGQMLRIPLTVQSTAVPPRPAPVQSTAVPTPDTCPCEEIVILSPSRGVTITSPALVSGFASSPFEQTVVVTVLDSNGSRIGLASGTIMGEYGQRGPFSVTVPFSSPVSGQPGRIQVFTESPRDGAMEHLSSVTVMLQGSEQDALLGELDAALRAKDYATLESLMGPSFSLSLHRSEGTHMGPAEIRERLQLSYLGPGAPRLDFSVDARALLGAQVHLAPEISRVVYSTGWGPNPDKPEPNRTVSATNFTNYTNWPL